MWRRTLWRGSLLVYVVGTLLVVAPFAVVGLGASPVGPAEAAPENATAANATANATTNATTNATLVARRAATPGDDGLLVARQWGPHTRYDDAGRVAWRVDHRKNGFDGTVVDDSLALVTFAHEAHVGCGDYDAPCGVTGVRLVTTNGTPETVFQWAMPVRRTSNREIHDAEWVPHRDEIVVADMAHERLVAVDVRDGNETWTFDLATVYEAPPDPTKRDWLHLNDVDYLGDGRYLLSVRNANQLLVVERTATGGDVVEVINADEGERDASCRGFQQLRDQNGDGDVRCGDPTVVNHQHNPHWLGDGRVLVADSENDRVVRLDREPDGDWTVGWTLRYVDGERLDWPRDADRLPNGHTLVTDTDNNRVVAVDERGRQIWSRRVSLPYEADVVGVEEPSPDALAAVSDATATATSETPRATRTPRTPRADSGTTAGAVAHLRDVGEDALKAAYVVGAPPSWVRPWHLSVTLVGFGLHLVALGGGLVCVVGRRVR